MPGFYVSNINGQALSDHFGVRRAEDAMRLNEGFYCSRCTIDKFMADKAFYEDDRYAVICEGVLQNKSELLSGFSKTDVAKLVIRLYEARGDCFFERFRGSFSGALYDKNADKWIFYTNHYGDNALFYYFNSADGGFAFGSHPGYVLGCLRDAGIAVTSNDMAYIAMLSYAFMIDGSTYVNEIKRLLPGYFAIVEKGELRIECYYRPKDVVVEVPRDEREAICELDRLFRQAVKREFDKDLEYGLRHACDLSGGLDSRMTTWVAREMGYGPVLNLTYSQSGYIDERVAEEIADYLGNDLLFKPLDSANFLFDADRLVEMNAGLSLYSGITGGESLLRALNWDEYGIEHTGQVGDVVVGSFVNDASHLYSFEHSGAYSNRVLELLPPLESSNWRDLEQYLFCTRAFLGALSTHFIRRNYTEIASPFLDIDFLNYCMNLPIEWRAGHRIYKKWIARLYPNAAKFIWEKEGVPLTVGKGRIAYEKARRKGQRIITQVWPTGEKAFRANMNPMEYWYRTKPQIRNYMDSQMCLPMNEVAPEIAELVRAFYKTGSAIEKTQAVTAACAARYWHG